MSKLRTYSPDILAFAFCVLFFVYLYPNLSLLPIHDSVIYFSDAVRDGLAKGLNPFHPAYELFGHPPGTSHFLFLWWRVLPASAFTAQLFFLLFACAALLALFFMLKTLMSAWLALTALTAVMICVFVQDLAPQANPDLPALFWICLSLFFWQRRDNLLLSISLLFFVYFRETALATITAILFSGLVFPARLSRQEKKKLVASCLPALVLLVAFYGVTKLTRGELFTHPYAQNAGDLFYGRFFALENINIANFAYVFEQTTRYLSPVYFLLPGAPLLLWFLRRRIQPHKTNLHGAVAFGLTAFFYLAFFIMHGDAHPRDLLPVTTLLLVLPFWFFQFLPPKPSMAAALTWVLICFALPSHSPRAFQFGHREQNKALLQHLEQYHQRTPVCLQGFAGFMARNEVHGYVKSNSAVNVKCHAFNLLPVCSHFAEPIQQKLNRLVNDSQMQAVETIKTSAAGDTCVIFRSDTLSTM